MYLCSGETKPIQTIVEALLLPQELIQKAILNLFFDLFMVDSKRYFIDLNLASPGKGFLEASESDGKPTSNLSHHSIAQNYLALLTAVFIDVNLLNATFFNMINDA